MTRGGDQRIHRRETDESLKGRIEHHFAVLFITLLSVLIGLVFADLVSEARKMVLWPLDSSTLRTWGQLAAHGSSTLTAWVVFSHIGVSRERVPVLADSVVIIIVPLTLLLAMSLIGKEQIWPYFYYGAFSLGMCLVTSMWLLHLSRDEPELAHLNHLLRTRGFFAIFYAGIPAYAAAGWLDQQDLLSPVLEVVFAMIPTPLALLAAHLFSRDWRDAVAGLPEMRRAA